MTPLSGIREPPGISPSLIRDSGREFATSVSIPSVPYPPVPISNTPYHGKHVAFHVCHLIYKPLLLLPYTSQCTAYHTLSYAGFSRPVRNTVSNSIGYLSGSQIIHSCLSMTLPSPFHKVGKPSREVAPRKRCREA